MALHTRLQSEREDEFHQGNHRQRRQSYLERVKALRWVQNIKLALSLTLFRDGVNILYTFPVLKL